jgi:uncharacterized protein YaeQ
MMGIMPESSARAAPPAARAMTITCTVQDGNVWLASATQTIELTPQLAN